jgi:hypothetical protein
MANNHLQSARLADDPTWSPREPQSPSPFPSAIVPSNAEDVVMAETMTLHRQPTPLGGATSPVLPYGRQQTVMCGVYELAPLASRTQPYRSMPTPSLPPLRTSISLASPDARDSRSDDSPHRLNGNHPSTAGHNRNPDSPAVPLYVSPSSRVTTRHHPYNVGRSASVVGPADVLSPPAIDRLTLSRSPKDGYFDPRWPGSSVTGERMPRSGVGPPSTEMMSPGGPMLSMMPYKRLTGKVNTPSACAACKK